MSHDPLIAAARRRARLLQRADARPYQTHLDEVARETGSDDWATFVADPKPLPEQPVQKTPQEGTDPTLAWLSLSCMAGATIAFLSITIDIANGDAIIWTILAGCSIMTLSYLPLSIERCIRFLARPGKGDNRHDDRQYATRIEASRKMALSTILVGVACFGVMAMRNHVDQQTMGDIIADRSDRAKIMFDGTGKPIPITRVIRNGDIARLRAVFVDARLSWISFRSGLNPTDRTGGRAMVKSYIDHPVIRMVLDVDCRSGRWRPIGVETSDDYEGPAVHSYRHRPALAWKRPLPASSVATVCGGGRSMA